MSIMKCSSEFRTMDEFLEFAQIRFLKTLHPLILFASDCRLTLQKERNIREIQHYADLINRIEEWLNA